VPINPELIDTLGERLARGLVRYWRDRRGKLDLLPLVIDSDINITKLYHITRR
jgi:hypothetical protein